MPVTELELQNFTEYVTEQIAGDNAPSLEQCLNRWRAEREREETIAAIRRGAADADAGRVHSLEEVDREIRAKYGLPRNGD